MVPALPGWPGQPNLVFRGDHSKNENGLPSMRFGEGLRGESHLPPPFREGVLCFGRGWVSWLEEGQGRPLPTVAGQPPTSAPRGAAAIGCRREQSPASP